MALRLASIDRWTLGYAAASSIALVARWHDPLPARESLVLAQLLLFAVPLMAPRARQGGALGRFFGEWYPVALVTALYTEVGLLNRAAAISHDAAVQRWESAVFGGQPAVSWMRAQPWPALSWVLHLGYLSYYFIVLGAPLGLWLTGRRQGARRTILLMAVTFYTCFVVFLIFPVVGPRYTFPAASNAASRTPIARFTWALLDRAAAWGTAFPSSHVAVALAGSLTAFRYWRPLGAVLVTAAVLLALGTVYGQFHYAVDALGGAVVAAVVLAVAGRSGCGEERRRIRP